MADGSFEGAERDAAEDTDELLYTGQIMSYLGL
jgi:hypothetical protein